MQTGKPEAKVLSKQKVKITEDSLRVDNIPEAVKEETKGSISRGTARI